MKSVQETTIFEYIHQGKEDNLNRQMVDILTKKMIPLNTILDYQLRTVGKMFNDSLTRATLKEVEKGSIQLFYVENPKDSMPPYMPFIKSKRNGVPNIAIDITSKIRSRKDKGGEMIYDIDVKQLYCYIISGYLYLTKFDKNTALSSTLLKYTSIIWARMFCRILELKVGLGTNKERYDAFMYFAIRFFLTNICEAPVGICDSISKAYFRSGVSNAIVTYAEDQVSRRQIDMYSDLTTFCTTLFDNSITGIRALRVAGSSDELNYQFFISQYITQYHLTAVLSLESFPYFMWVIFSANNWAYLFNDKLIESMCTDEFPHILQELNRMASSSST